MRADIVSPAPGAVIARFDQEMTSKVSSRMTLGAWTEMRKIARADRRHRQYDQHIGGAELMINDRAVADEGAKAQISLDQRRQQVQRRFRGDCRLRHAVKLNIAVRQRHRAPRGGGARVVVKE